MDKYSFILSFITEFAVSFLFVSSLVSSLKPINWKIVKNALIGIIILTIIGTNYNFYINLFLSSVFLIYGVILFIQAINYRAKQNAIKNHNNDNNKKIETKYNLNDTVKTINNTLFFLTSCIFIFISSFVGKNDISSFVGIFLLLLVLFIVINYYSKTRSINEDDFDVGKIKTILSTLMALTLIFSVILYLTLILIPVDNYLNNKFILYPVFAFAIVIPPIIVSNYLLGRLRLTFFINKQLSQYFISNLLTYTIITLIFTIILSDAIVVYSIIKSQNDMSMILWVNGFVIFIGMAFLDIISKSYSYKLESNLITIKDIL